RIRALDMVAIRPDAQPRVMRCEHDGDQPTHTIRCDARDDISDERVPVFHRDVRAILARCSRVEPALESRRRLARDREQWSPPTNQLVSIAEVGDRAWGG